MVVLYRGIAVSEPNYQALAIRSSRNYGQGRDPVSMQRGTCVASASGPSHFTRGDAAHTSRRTRWLVSVIADTAGVQHNSSHNWGIRRLRAAVRCARDSHVHNSHQSYTSSVSMNLKEPLVLWRNNASLFVTLILRALVLINVTLWFVKFYLRLGSKSSSHDT